MTPCSATGSGGPVVQLSMVVSYPATSLLGVRSPFSPPSTHTTLPWTVLPTSWRAAGELRTGFHGDAALAAGAGCAPPADVNGRTSATLVAVPWLGIVAPSIAYTEFPTVAAARPWRA